jgi:hypothetical protein
MTWVSLEMATNRLIFRLHAVRRMMHRGIQVEDVRQVLAAGDVIEDYPNDYPYPSRLELGFCGARPLHVVAAENIAGKETIVITVYEPDSAQWDTTFRVRRTP